MPVGEKLPILRSRDIKDARPQRVANRTTDCDTTGNCAESCSSCESSSAASCSCGVSVKHR